MKTNLNGQMGRPAQWHACVHSNILEEAGKEQVKLTPADQVVGRPGMHSSTFRASACEFSLGEEVLAAYLSKKTWPSPNPESYSMLPLAQHGLRTFAGHLEELSMLWLSLLLPPMCIVMHGSRLLESSCFWVLASTNHGSLVWRAELHFVAGKSWIQFANPGAGQPWTMLHVTDPLEWYVLPCKAASPARVRAGMQGVDLDLGMAGFALEVTDERPVGCMRYCAQSECFQRFTVPQMQQLIVIAGVAYVGPRPKLEADVVAVLVKHFCPGATEGELMQIYALRAKMKQPLIKTIITPELAALVEEAVVPEDLEAMEKDVLEKHHAKHLKRKRHSEKQKGDGQAEASAAALLGAPAAPANPSRRQLRPIQGLVFTGAQAKRLVPQGVGCTITIHTGRSWQVKYPRRASEGYKSHSATWGPTLSHRDALLECLRWVWPLHTEATSEECPFDLEG